MPKRNKEKTNDKKTNVNDEESVIIVDQCLFYPHRNNPPLTLDAFLDQFLYWLLQEWFL